MSSFWLILFIGILLWYLLVSMIVAWRGLGNIIDMIKGLQQRDDQAQT